MPSALVSLPAGPVLWRIMGHGRHRYLPGRPYWYDNRDRQPFGHVVFQYTLSGAMVLRDAAGEHTVGTGQAALFAYGQPNSYGLTRAHRQPYFCWWVNLAGSGLLEHLQAIQERHGSVLALGRESGVEQRLAELVALAGDRGAGGVTRQARGVADFVYWLIEWAEQALFGRQSPVQRAVEHILRQPTAPLSLKAVSALHGVSREHLSRVFAARVGQSPAMFLARARIEHALRLLAQTDLPVAAVAQQSGFASPHTLARLVRRATGRVPSELRRQRPDTR